MPTPTKPAKTLIAKALPHSDGWRGQFALPGHVPDHVRDKTNRPVTFSSEQEAEAAAREAVITAMRASLEYRRKPGRYELIAPADFASMLNEADITARHFAELLGVGESRVIKWLNGEADIPHWAHLIVTLLLDEGNYQRAARLTDVHLKEPDPNE